MTTSLRFAAFAAALTAAPLASASPSLHDAAEAGDLVVVTDMVAHGAQVNAGDGKLQFTPLMGAAYGGHLDVIAFLLAHGAAIDQQDVQGSTALLHATSGNQTDAALALLKAGANPNVESKWKRTPLEFAADKGNDTVVAALIAAHANLDSSNDEGPALSWAAASYRSSTVKLLLDAGANVNLADKFGRTPLDHALLSHDPATVLAVLAAHPNMELKDSAGQTSLIIAAKQGNIDLVKPLVAAGADVNATDNQGETALTHAGSTGFTDIVTLLASSGATRTDLHVIPRTKPMPTLPPERAWALAVGAIYTQRNNNDQRCLGGDEAVPRAKNLLSKWWGIKDKAGLVKELDDLQHHGHHAEYQAMGAKLAAMSSDEFQAFLTQHPDHEPQIEAEKQSYLTWKDRSGLAWDLCRASMLVNEGYAAHYLKEDESWARLMDIARETQRNFSSWDEMANNFLDARKVWDGDFTTEVPSCVKLLLNPKDPNSPWNQLAWTTDLSAG